MEQHDSEYEKFYVSKDGVNVYIHPEASHIHRPDLAFEAISKIKIGDEVFLRETVDLNRVIGVDHLVTTTIQDDGRIVYFERRPGSGYKSRMVLKRKPKDTSKVTAVIAKCDDNDGTAWSGKYVVITLFEGEPGMPEPYGRNENNRECIEFWKTHALVPTEDELQMIQKLHTV